MSPIYVTDSGIETVGILVQFWKQAANILVELEEIETLVIFVELKLANIDIELVLNVTLLTAEAAKAAPPTDVVVSGIVICVKDAQP